jgi:hypothetical protein
MRLTKVSVVAVAVLASLVPAIGSTQNYAAVPRTADRRGTPDGAFAFAGTQELVTNNPLLPIGAQPRTLSVWFRTTAASGARVVANWGSPSQGARFGILLDTGHVKFVGESADLTSPRTFADGAWHHAAVTYNGAFATLYVDGSIEASGRLMLNTVGTTMTIGNAVRGHAPEFFQGSIDDVLVFDHALTPAQVAAVASL